MATESPALIFTDSAALKVGELIREEENPNLKLRVYVAGGGSHNRYLMKRLQTLQAGRHVETTAQCGLDPDWVEAAAFAWLARETLARRPVDLTRITGAQKPAVLGGIYTGK